MTSVRAHVIRYEAWRGSVLRRLQNRGVNTSRVPHRLYHDLYDRGAKPAEAAREIAGKVRP